MRRRKSSFIHGAEDDVRELGQDLLAGLESSPRACEVRRREWCMGRSLARIVVWSVACSIGSLVSGCTSTRHFQAYDGPERKGVQAIIRSDGLKANEYFRILAIDGREMAVGGAQLFAGQVVSAGLLPGAHNIECEIRLGTTFVTPRLELNAAAGETYLVKFEARGYGIRVWVESARTGAEKSAVVGRGDGPY
jgi:hypothetical protein